MLWRSLCIALALVLADPLPARAEQRLDVTIAERQIVGGETTVRVSEGDDVALHWHSDEDVELHLHGYEIAIQVPGGGSAAMTFKANVSGRFPISHHGFGAMMGQEHSEQPIFYIEIYPK